MENNLRQPSIPTVIPACAQSRAQRERSDRALVQLGSGEYICVDTNSPDSINYHLSWDMEAAVLAVFRSFLQPGTPWSWYIGANFKLYTAAAASVVKDPGRLYAGRTRNGSARLL